MPHGGGEASLLALLLLLTLRLQRAELGVRACQRGLLPRRLRLPLLLQLLLSAPPLVEQHALLCGKLPVAGSAQQAERLCCLPLAPLRLLARAALQQRKTERELRYDSY